jgi:hypothetical protein
MSKEGTGNTLDLLRDEYKILQDKIDKIGAFRFTIRGWSVTAVIGGFLAGSGSKTLPVPLASISVGVALVFFFLFEKEQVVLSNRFMARTREVEELIKQCEGTAFAGPQISLSARRKRTRRIAWYDFYLPGIVRRTLLRRRKQISIWLEAHFVFYLVLGLLSFSPQWTPKIMSLIGIIGLLLISIGAAMRDKIV